MSVWINTGMPTPQEHTVDTHLSGLSLSLLHFYPLGKPSEVYWLDPDRDDQLNDLDHHLIWLRET